MCVRVSCSNGVPHGKSTSYVKARVDQDKSVELH